jgi:hypothetical protein
LGNLIMGIRGISSEFKEPKLPSFPFSLAGVPKDLFCRRETEPERWGRSVRSGKGAGTTGDRTVGLSLGAKHVKRTEKKTFPPKIQIQEKTTGVKTIFFVK